MGHSPIDGDTGANASQVPPGQHRLVTALLQLLRTQHPGEAVRLIETHISFVLLTQALAYKIKKAVSLGFVDFSSLARRRFYCDEELRLNRRLAPELYLEVIDITGTVDEPRLGGTGEVIEHALKMRAFPQHGLWDTLVVQGGLSAQHLDQLAGQLCALHEGAAVSGPQTGFGLPDKVRAPMLDNLDALGTLLPPGAERADLDRLRCWEAQRFAALTPKFERRQREGRVRECHGDLHLGNLTMIDGRPVMFDCLEFNEELRWTDVMSDVAFLAMDLQSHQRADLAHRFVNAYIECSADHDGARVLRYYMVHRALVRAKVAALRANQARGAEVEASSRMRDRYLASASELARAPRPTLMLAHGFSGSGKTSFTQSLIEALGAIRVRADVERKRLHGLDATRRSGSALNAGLYSAQATAATYGRLQQAARAVLDGGFNVILDATFLQHAQRLQARALAADMGAAFVLLDFRAHVATLRQRVRRREALGLDASEANLEVLESQIARDEPLQPDESDAVFAFDAELPLEPSAVAAAWAPLIEQLAAPSP